MKLHSERTSIKGRRRDVYGITRVLHVTHVRRFFNIYFTSRSNVTRAALVSSMVGHNGE